MKSWVALFHTAAASTLFTELSRTGRGATLEVMRLFKSYMSPDLFHFIMSIALFKTLDDAHRADTVKLQLSWIFTDIH